MNQHPTKKRKIISTKETMRRSGVKARSTLWRRAQDPEDDFPRPVECGNGRIGYFEDEVEAWINSRPRVSYAHTSEAA